MRRTKTRSDIEVGLSKLLAIDPTLAPIREIAGLPPLRQSQPNFHGLAEIIVSQHVSKRSAAAIFGRLRESVKPLTAKRFVASTDAVLVAVGLTRAKQQTLRAVAEAIIVGDLELKSLSELPSEEAIAKLTQFKGIGPWTAEVFLLFCAGHVDLFPAKDVALQTALGEVLGIEPRPTPKECLTIAARWAPYRSLAARLFWAYYAKRK